MVKKMYLIRLIVSRDVDVSIYMCSNYLRTTAITKVREAMVLTIEATKVGDVYLKLAKYVFSVKPTLSMMKKT